MAAPMTVATAAANSGVSIPGGVASMSSWPSASHNAAASRTAATQSGWAVYPPRGLSENAIRSRPGSAPTSSAKGRDAGGAQYGSPIAGPEIASRRTALSRTERVTACSTARPFTTSPYSGPNGFRARLGFRPNSPQHDAGYRIEPPRSLASAIGTMPDATAAAEPPLDPPGVRSVSHGFRVAPNKAGSHTGRIPNSGVFVF